MPRTVPSVLCNPEVQRNCAKNIHRKKKKAKTRVSLVVVLWRTPGHLPHRTMYIAPSPPPGPMFYARYLHSWIRVGAIKESVGNISCRESFPKTHVRYWHPLGCRAIELEKPLQGEVCSHRRTWVVDGVLMYPSNEVLVPGVPQRVYPTKERYYRRRKKMP